MNRARLTRYSLYQLADYFWERGAMVVVIGVFNLASSVIMLHNMSAKERVVVPGNDVAKDILITFGTLMLLAVLFSSQELIGRSRKLGYYKLIFAKPVDPVRFYAQLFLVNLIGTLIVVAALAAIFTIIAVPVSVVRIAAVTACAFVLLGGIGFLASAFTNYDSLLVIVIVGVSLLVSGYGEAHGGTAAAVATVLPPVQQMHRINALMIGQSVSQTDVVWALAYGIAAFVAGLVALRYRQLAD